jgi:thiamine kinase-like enzyme
VTTLGRLLGRGKEAEVFEYGSKAVKLYRLCHFDLYPENVLGEPANAVVIDWLDAVRGDPGAATA